MIQAWLEKSKHTNYAKVDTNYQLLYNYFIT